jgi:CubicO group peptidase (beta-lactamase class C family)
VEDSPIQDPFYFPPISSNEWETKSPTSLGWDESKLEELYDFLESNDTRAFLILKDGRIVTEKYWGKDLLDRNNFTAQSQWYWASAGKSLTAVMIGIAQQKGLLSIEESSQKHLGEGWTSLPVDQEKKITIKNQLSMTTGLNFTNTPLDCTDPSCLTYKTEPDQQWYYHNAPYTLLHKIIEKAGSTNYNNLTDDWIENQIGMNGMWRAVGDNNVYFSTARDAARFGLLSLARGSWNDNRLYSEDYVNQMTNSSQNLNPSYGYLWWLNGKSSVQFPSSTQSLPTSLLPNAPADMYSALGANEQIIDIIPSENLVVIRMGSSSETSEVPIAIHTGIWNYLQQIID